MAECNPSSMRTLCSFRLIVTAAVIGHMAPVQSGTAFAQADRPQELMTAPNSPNQKAEPSASGGQQGTANICRELIAFLEQQARTRASQAAAGAKPATETAAPAGQASQSADRPQRTSGQSAPIPSAQPSTAPTQISPDEAKSLLEVNDLRTCRDRAREMRRAGVALPPGLLALAALREELLLAPGK
jgi:hypothetical protein